MTVTTVERAVRLPEMGRVEAEAITETIKENFNSLGSMLMEARDKKAYKALGYRTFDGYCKTEFGKSISSAYRAIEDAKVVAQLEAEIAKQYDEPITLNIPSSCLRPLKNIPDVIDKLKAIEYAKNLATAEGKKTTKKHLEIAVFEISGKRSQDYKAAIQSLGFTKGVPVEIKDAKSSRGLVKKVDELGKIHVALYSGGVYPRPLGASDLRILMKAEKPTNPLNEITASKGDRVLIFAKDLEGKKGIIHEWKDECQALVTVDGEEKLATIAYAEMELIREQEEANWESELVWEAGKKRYYYFPQEDTICSDTWPQGLALKPHCHEKSPTEFMREWEDKFAGDLLESLMTPARLKTLALAQAISLPDNEGKEFAADLIASLNQLFPQSKPKAMGISFALTINELTSGKKTQTRRAWQDDYAKNFIRYFDENIAIPALNEGRHRGGHELGFIKLTQRPYQQYLSEMSSIDLQEEGGMVASTQEFIDTYFEGQDKLVWVLHFEFLSAPSSNNAAALIAENQRLREQLAEAELAIQVTANALREITTTKILPNNTNTSEPTLPEKIKAQAGLLVRRFEDEYRNGEPYQIIEIDEEGGRINCLKPSGFTEWIHESNLRVVVDQPMISRLLAKNTAEISSPGVVDVDIVDTIVDTVVDTTEIDSWRQMLETNHFIPVPFKLDGYFRGHWRGWDFFFHIPNGGVIAIDLANSDKHEMFTRSTECDFAIDLTDEDKIIEWVKALVNQIEDFCPGQLSLQLQIEPTSAVDTTVDAELKREIAQWRNETNEAIARNTQRLADATTKPVRERLKKEISDSRSRLIELDAFENIEIGQAVEKKIREGIHGKVTKLDFSPGGLPQAWVQWSDKKYPESCNTFSLNLSPVISPPSSSPDPSTEKDIRLLRENLLAWKVHAEEELAAAEEHNKSIFTQKIEARSANLEQLQKFSKLRVGQYVVDKLSPRRGKIIAMHAKTERLVVEIEWGDCGKTELKPFRDIVPEQISDENRQAITLPVE